jgi:hypothetical protein
MSPLGTKRTDLHVLPLLPRMARVGRARFMGTWPTVTRLSQWNSRPILNVESRESENAQAPASIRPAAKSEFVE